MLFETNQKIVFVGDSITDCHRQDTAAPYGNGYVRLVRSLLLARYPSVQLAISNKGVSGNTVRDLAGRWHEDVLAEEPDWVVVFIGINDVWRAFGLAPAEAVALPEYTDTLRSLLEVAVARGARLLLLEPYVIEADRSFPMRRQMDRYGAAVRQLAEELDAVAVPIQAAWDTVLADTSSDDWSADQIHPNDAGHAVLALAVLRAIGFTF